MHSFNCTVLISVSSKSCPSTCHFNTYLTCVYIFYLTFLYVDDVPYFTLIWVSIVRLLLGKYSAHIDIDSALQSIYLTCDLKL